ncbi:cysteine-rich secretory protein 3-like [Paramacrobiotus metropolitanus]|uniref:cysteine-rich secretory protein 3-like n=1 Tax=Paramacrobiotus metropolitanus TaxID=2943436 RepID=UPI002445D457|nr:cysteine-rich secretory protein 3-like [Paramacrobiotus metropolitanus]
MLKMRWSSSAAQKAQDWADQCRGGHNSASERRTTQFGCGQNLLRTFNGPFSWNDVLQIWSTDEARFFRYGHSGNNPSVVGHYVQMIWAGTFQVGCGYRNCGSWQLYVCHYCPSASNYHDALRPYKAGTACSACPGQCHHNLCVNSCPYENRYSNCEYMARYRGLCQHPTLASGCKASCHCGSRNLLYTP